MSEETTEDVVETTVDEVEVEVNEEVEAAPAPEAEVTVEEPEPEPEKEPEPAPTVPSEDLSLEVAEVELGREAGNKETV